MRSIDLESLKLYNVLMRSKALYTNMSNILKRSKDLYIHMWIHSIQNIYLTSNIYYNIDEFGDGSE
jgi:hypothetical protein